MKMAKLDLKEMLRTERIAKEGRLGVETRAKIAAKLQEAEALENRRGLGAREATEAVQKAASLRYEAEALSKWMQSSEFEVTAGVRNRQDDEKVLDTFSGMQRGFIEQNAARQSEVNRLLRESVNFLVGTNPRHLERQVGRLLDGEGETDAQGNRYVDFELPESAAVNRAVMLPTGQIGFMVASRSSKSSAGE